MIGASFKALLSPLKGSLILFGAVWVGMGLLAYYVAHVYDQSLVELNDAKLALQTAQTQQNQQQQNLAWLSQYQPAYEHWQAVGLVGEEQRLNWVHRLQTIQKQQQLPVVQYTVAEQMPYMPAFVSLGRFLMRKSSMHLDMLAQGDMDTQMLGTQMMAQPEDAGMVRLLKAMRTQHPATMQVQHCHFKVLSKSMQSSCDIDWLTLQDPLYQTPQHETGQ
jgi:hypothetical protein